MSRTVTGAARGILAAGAMVAAVAGPACAQADVTLSIGVMNWQGNAAQAPVQIVNTTAVPMRAAELACEFVSVGRIVGADRQVVPPLGPGQQATVSVSADTGGQLVDSIRCRIL
jgi:hypothetical protein